MQRRIVAVTLERASRVPTLARSALERVAVVRDADARILHAGAASAWHSRLREEEQLVLKKCRSVGEETHQGKRPCRGSQNFCGLRAGQKDGLRCDGGVDGGSGLGECLILGREYRVVGSFGRDGRSSGSSSRNLFRTLGVDGARLYFGSRLLHRLGLLVRDDDGIGEDGADASGPTSQRDFGRVWRMRTRTLGLEIKGKRGAEVEIMVRNLPLALRYLSRP